MIERLFIEPFTADPLRTLRTLKCDCDSYVKMN